MLKRFILWDYPRGSRPYDAIVAIILAFIFLTPRGFFRDQPRVPSIVEVPSESRVPTFHIGPEVLANVPENQRVARLTEILRQRPGKQNVTITRVEPILDSEGELQGYMAFARP
jgi:hypothetical protein